MNEKYTAQDAKAAAMRDLEPEEMEKYLGYILEKIQTAAEKTQYKLNCVWSEPGFFTGSDYVSGSMFGRGVIEQVAKELESRGFQIRWQHGEFSGFSWIKWAP